MPMSNSNKGKQNDVQIIRNNMSTLSFVKETPASIDREYLLYWPHKKKKISKIIEIPNNWQRIR